MVTLYVAKFDRTSGRLIEDRVEFTRAYEREVQQVDINPGQIAYFRYVPAFDRELISVLGPVKEIRSPDSRERSGIVLRPSFMMGAKGSRINPRSKKAFYTNKMTTLAWGGTIDEIARELDGDENNIAYGHLRKLREDVKKFTSDLKPLLS